MTAMLAEEYQKTTIVELLVSFSSDTQKIGSGVFCSRAYFYGWKLG